MKKSLQKWVLTLPIGLFLMALVLQSCEDHRLPPAAPTLPDQIFYALTDNNQLYELNVRNTSAPLRTLTISGLQPGETILGIDFRPATGQLYSVGSSSRLYHINLQSGAATALGTGPFTPAIEGTMFGFDFNPTVDRIRLVSNTTQDLRLHPETGAVVSIDGNLNGYPNPMVAAVAYSNSFAGTTTTRLYDIDATTDRLYLQDPPNDGGLKDIGPLGIDISAVGGFDLSADDNYGIASVMFNGKWELSYVDLATGKLQKLGDLPSGTITGIAIPTNPVAYAVDLNNTLHIFNPKKFPITSLTRSITGLPTGVTIEGIDFRPVNGQLHALGSNGNLYAINLSNGAASMLSVLSVALDGTSFGVDFNPVADRLRIVSNTRQNLRVNVTTGAAITDGTLTPVSGTVTPFINGAAYTNSFAGTTSTVLYDIDSQTNKLYKQNPPNDGGLEEIGSLGVTVDAANGFDIGGTTGDAYALLTVGGVSGLYKINLTNGSAFRISDFPAGVKGFALGFGL
ncbi:DUF4394 domain-containing protein [Persicitalea jodogahamensis]|uniref:DUF4394 domain-containing protein n=1 Tax=Persicitalea jodogahamensis TaxID=402147 RepID=A0A8J3D3Q4_9BACT|nr:DUF4394 domain-containing protein [Persicitalea jodogahamensis]GHB77508.1 hypothetical protein GCM10007390_34590 [Persicitalea jodogahamensis]